MFYVRCRCGLLLYLSTSCVPRVLVLVVHSFHCVYYLSDLKLVIIHSYNSTYGLVYSEMGVRERIP